MHDLLRRSASPLTVSRVSESCHQFPVVLETVPDGLVTATVDTNWPAATGIDFVVVACADLTEFDARLEVAVAFTALLPPVLTTARVPASTPPEALTVKADTTAMRRSRLAVVLYMVDPPMCGVHLRLMSIVAGPTKEPT